MKKTLIGKGLATVQAVAGVAVTLVSVTIPAEAGPTGYGSGGGGTPPPAKKPEKKHPKSPPREKKPIPAFSFKKKKKHNN